MKRGFAIAISALAGLVLLALLAGWTMRFRIATSIVDRKLAAAHVPASYRLTRIGPFRERMENVRIGNPRAPDLLARRIEVQLGYGWGGPTVRAIRADGVRLRARLDSGGLSLGALDRLMPQTSGGQTKLPNLTVRLHDVRLALATPNGAIRARIEGAGNPQVAFRGTAEVTASSLRLASCALSNVEARLALAALGGKPRAEGPVRIARSACPGLELGAGRAQTTLSSDRIFEKVAVRARLDGFGGKIGPLRFAGMSGPIEASGRIGNLAATARLDMRSIALPDAARRATRLGAMLAGTPVGPTGRRAADAVARMLAKSDAVVTLAAALNGTRADVHLKRVDLTDADGARASMVERGGIGWSPQGWRMDGDATIAGGSMPEVDARIRQTAPGAPLTAIVQLADYSAGTARLGAAALRLGWDGHGATFETVLRIDGPLGGGFIRGLTIPVRGAVTPGGDLIVNRGCQAVSFGELRLSGFIFDAARMAVCGRPAVALQTGGLRIDVATGPVRLAGHTSAGAPLTLSVASVHLTQAGFAVTAAKAALGPAGRETHFAIDKVDGAFGDGAIGGTFMGASGAIANVPLVIADAGGGWRFADGRLHLAGKLRVADAAAAARFSPLATDDATLALEGGVIRATATLHEPASGAEITRVNLEHDLTSGSGHALLNVPGITFVPKGLQPEALTPLTLGVIANVAGTVLGQGRIDWSPEGVTSKGTFGTDRIDLAAAFGPVTGIKGQVHFTDLLGLVTAPGQEAAIAEINPGVQVANGVVHYQLTGQNRVKVNDATWPFAGGTLRLEPTLLDFGAEAERHLTFRIEGLDAAAFVQQLDFPNISATGTFDGVLPMIFDQSGGRIEAGHIVARKGGGTLAYVGQISNAQLGTMGKLAFDALKAIRYSSLDISLDGRLDGEMVSRVRFTGVREATPEQSLIARLIRNLPFRFNIAIRAPFRGLVGSARAYMDPRLLLNQAQPAPAPPASATPAEPAIQTKESAKPL